VPYRTKGSARGWLLVAVAELKNARDRALLEALLDGLNVKQAAERSGTSLKTAYRRLAEVRKARGWTQKYLAERIAERGGVGLGQPLHRVRLAKLESDPEKARRVTLEEVLAISYALDVSPLYMIAPIEQFPPPRLLVTGEVQAADPEDARAWLSGEEPLLNQDEFTFVMQRPASDITRQLQQSTQYPKEERR
jgi:transcriptional regulator with XRE-family HTH domain